MKKSKKVEIVVGTISVLFLAWIVVSLVDVVAHNTLANGGTTAWWNCFKMLVDAASAA